MPVFFAELTHCFCFYMKKWQKRHLSARKSVKKTMFTLEKVANHVIQYNYDKTKD